MSRSILLGLARESIEEVLQAEKSIDRDGMLSRFPPLKEAIATFVTIRIDGEMRGRAGAAIAQRSLMDDVIHNAKMAAFEDPDFSPLTTSEYLRASIEVSVLTEPIPVIYLQSDDLKKKIRPGTDGILLSLNDHQSAMLPQEWEEFPSFKDFFSHLGKKAGLGSHPLKRHPDIFVFQAEIAADTPLLS